jgi:HEAT repeat protein
MLTLAVALAAVAVLASAQAGGTLLKKEQIPRAIALLKTGSPEQRVLAAEALGKRGAVRASDVKEAVPLLRALLANHRDPRVRRAAAEALGNIGLEPDETVPALVTTMKSDRVDQVKLAAIAALGQMGPEARAALPELRQVAAQKAKNRRLSRAARMAMKAINAR